MKYPLFGSYNSNSAPTNAAVRYLPYVNGSATLYVTDPEAQQLVSEAMTLSYFNILLQVAPGAGASWNFTVMKNGVATALSVTVSGTNLIGAENGAVVSFAAGDAITVRITPSGSPAFSSGSSWTAIAESVNQVVLGRTNTSFANAQNYVPMYGTGGSGSSSTEAAVTTVMPTDGTFSKLFVALSAAPGTGTSKIITMYKNGVAQALTATIADTNTTNSDTTHSVACVAGDTISFNINYSGVPASVAVAWGVSFAPTVAGESFFGPATGGVQSSTLTGYTNVPIKVAYVTTDDFNVRFAIGPWRIKNICLKTAVATGAGKSYTATLRKNAADTSLTVTAAQTTTAQFASGPIDIAQGDVINISVTPNGTPTGTRCFVGFTTTELPAPPSRSTRMMMGVG